MAYGPLSLLDRRAQSLGCARCGTCCEVIPLGFDPRKRTIYAADRHAENEALYRDHWTVEWAEERPEGVAYVVTCNAYDPERRICTHPNRPPICRDYPHYDVPPVTGTVLDVKTTRMPQRDGASCSYWLDVPGWAARGERPMLPIAEVRHGAT